MHVRADRIPAGPRLSDIQRIRGLLGHLRRDLMEVQVDHSYPDLLRPSLFAIVVHNEETWTRPVQNSLVPRLHAAGRLKVSNALLEQRENRPSEVAVLLQDAADRRVERLDDLFGIPPFAPAVRKASGLSKSAVP